MYRIIPAFTTCAIVLAATFLPAPSLAVNGNADPLAACRLPEMKVRGDVGLGFPRIPFRLKTIGEVRFAVLFVDFSDAPAGKTPQDILSIISPQAENFFRTVSYGKMNLIFEPHYRWIRMSKASADYGFHRGASFDTHKAYMQEAVDLAGAVDYSKADAILVVANPAAKVIDWGPDFAALPGRGIMAGGREFDNGATSGSDLRILGWTWFNHEIGHGMSLIDLAGPLPGNHLWHTYVGDFSVMGNPKGAAPEYLAWERWQLGWLDDSQVACISTANARVGLTPVERIGGTKMLVVPTGPTTAVIVESRHAEGFDHALPKSGPLVYVIDTRLSSHDGAIRVYPIDDKDERHWNAPMSLGQTITADGVSLTYVANSADGEQIQIVRAK